MDLCLGRIENSTHPMQIKQSPLIDKSMAFAVRIVKLGRYLQEQKEFILSKQVIRSGTSIGACIRESQQAESRKDFIHKLSIGLKEAVETKYWLELLWRTALIEDRGFRSLAKDNDELLKLLTSAIKKSKESLHT